PTRYRGIEARKPMNRRLRRWNPSQRLQPVQASRARRGEPGWGARERIGREASFPQYTGAGPAAPGQGSESQRGEDSGVCTERDFWIRACIEAAQVSQPTLERRF